MSSILLLWRACMLKLWYWLDKHPKQQSTDNLSAGYVWMVPGRATGRDEKSYFRLFCQRENLMRGNSLNDWRRQASLALCLIPGPAVQPHCGLLNMLLLPANVIKLIVQLVEGCLKVEERLTQGSQQRLLVLHKIIVLLKKSKKKQNKTCKSCQELWWQQVI